MPSSFSVCAACAPAASPRPLPPQPPPWGYEPPQPPEPPRPWYRHPLGVFAIITGALLVVGLLANALNGGAQRSQVVLGFSESPEHVAKLAPFIDDGVWVT